MRLIGTVTNEVSASRFSDYLLTRKIDAHIEESSDGSWQVWIEHDDDLDAARAELNAFLASPESPQYGDSASAAAKIRKQDAKDAQRRRENYRDVRTSAAFSGITRHATPVAMGLVFICLILYAVGGMNEEYQNKLRELFVFDRTPPGIVDITRDGKPVFVKSFGAMFDDILKGQVWRLFTPILLHGSLMHIIFNMLWLWRLGKLIESIKGSMFFGGLVLAIAVFSCSTEAFWYEINGQWGFFIGMSGVNAGLLGYAWMKRKYQPYERIEVTDQEVGMMIGWLVICSFGIVGPIANAAHWGGLVVGLLIGVFPYWVRKMRTKK